MRERRWLLLALYGLLLATSIAGALKATRPKFKIATTSTTTTTTEEPDVADNENGEVESTTVSSDVNATTGHTLTGIPQIDYIWDPNLPRELNGFNLSDYPFYSGIPEEINFKCDGLHDGFYASVPHKCQVYHHCLFGTRFDFLCANFTAFDQKTFICHFASEVDCANSKKYWHRNDALYKTAETTTTSTTTTSTTSTTSQPPPGPGPRPGSRRRRPFRRRPAYDYYEDEYYDDELPYERTRPRGYDRRDDYDYEDRKYLRRDRERERDFRDRDYRDRDLPRSREPDRPLREPERPLKDDRETPLSPRERFPSRNNRRDPVRSPVNLPRDPVLDEETRNRNRDQDPLIRSREQEEPVDDRRQMDSRNREVDDRRPMDSKNREIDERRPMDSRNREVDDRRPSDSRNREIDDRRPSDSRNREIDDRRPSDSRNREIDDRRPSDSRNREIDDRRPSDSRNREIDDRRPSDSRNREIDDRLPLDSRNREIDDRRPSDSRNRDVDDRRYTDKGFRDDYEDDPASIAPASSSSSSDILVKPAAPASSVYARPRTPPKIRRPVPITEQEKFAYKATSGTPVVASEARRRPVEVPAEDDYYEDELEEVRPRRPASRRRPGFRDFYENPRERDRDRPFRSRYREDGDDLRPRKHQERNRERYYERGPERGRDRSLDRTKDRIPESTRDRTPERLAEFERPIAGRPTDRERDIERPRSSSRSKEPTEVVETTKRPSIYERTSVAPSTTSTTSTESSKAEGTIQNSSERPDRQFRTGLKQEGQNNTGKNVQAKTEHAVRPIESLPENREHRTEPQGEDKTRLEGPKGDEHSPKESNKPKSETEEYSSLEEYYDEPEYQQTTPPPPRTSVRIVKRPFLPSRGGNPNPRGLSPVGSKVPQSSIKEETIKNRPAAVQLSQGHRDTYRVSEHQQEPKKLINEDDNDKRPYNTYKFTQTDPSQKTQSVDYEEVISRPASRTPVENGRLDAGEIPTAGHLPTEQNRAEPQSLRGTGNDHDNSGGSVLRNAPGTRGRYSTHEETSEDREKPVLKWNSDEYRLGQRGDVRHEQETTQSGNFESQNRGKSRVTENSNYYGESYTSENNDQTPIGPTGNSATSKQTINEVVTHHRLQDIPESEYDVTLNEALTPSFNNQEGNLPSGFVLPIHRQLLRDPILQSTENSYKVSRPYNPQQQITSAHNQQQKSFIPSPQFLPLTEIASGNSNERSRSVQYFRTPEAVHVTGPQYRHQRGPWHDYTGY